LDLYWLAAHGQPVPPALWPLVLDVREALDEPYSWASVIKGIGENDGA